MHVYISTRVIVDPVNISLFIDIEVVVGTSWRATPYNPSHLFRLQSPIAVLVDAHKTDPCVCSIISWVRMPSLFQPPFYNFVADLHGTIIGYK